MSDEFRRGLDRAAGKGGVKCSCCGDSPGAARDTLRRLVKHRLKQNLLKAVKDAEAEAGDNFTPIVGAFYQASGDRVTYIISADYVKKEVVFFTRDSGPWSAPFDEVKSWEERPDLRDYPDSNDQVLPYEFDLLWDIKRMSQLKDKIRAADGDLEDIMESVERHGLTV